MKKRDIALGFAGAIGAAIAVKMLTRAKTVDWENVSDLIPHSENSKFVSVDGARVHYQEFGDVSKPTLIMIHGYTASLYVWKTVAPMLADRGVSQNGQELVTHDLHVSFCGQFCCCGSHEDAHVPCE